ncbi:glycosyltransferase family 4 protein [Sulfitobacter aestuarii]|uniref:Glycosyltransferase family 4 protein n=1 Tax=Sulfitobacter aestuarii TaxID=2161676 RepID=A0ABW5U160_9RHOB
MSLYINGRFLCQPLSGVQRYAGSLLDALDALLDADVALRARLGAVQALHPPGPLRRPEWRHIALCEVAGAQGHVWEQVALLRRARHGLLLSLCNSGPLGHPRQVLALHDAHIWRQPESFAWRYRQWHRLLRPRLARRAARLLTVSRFSAGELGRCLDLSAEDFAIVGNGADHLDHLADHPAALAQLDLPRAGFLLCVGNLSPNKNLVRLVAAHRLAGERLPELVIVGAAAPGVAHSALSAAPRLRLLGRVSDAVLRGLYARADGFVFPSLNEGFGIPPLEAMACGTPVLAARAGALPEVLGPAAHWCDPRDVNDMARALCDFCAMSQAQRRALVAKGRARAARFTWARAARALSAELLALAEPLPGQLALRRPA